MFPWVGLLEAAPPMAVVAEAAIPAAVVPEVFAFEPPTHENPPAGTPLGEIPQAIIPTGAAVPEAVLSAAPAAFVPAAVIPPQAPLRLSPPHLLPSLRQHRHLRRGRFRLVRHTIGGATWTTCRGRICSSFPDYNYVGRADEKPVDIDLEDQEPPDRVWCSRQHAVIHFDDVSGTMTIEDLNSSNGTYVNRNKVYPGSKQPLQIGDVIRWEHSYGRKGVKNST